MDMKKILQNMDAASVGNKPFKGDTNFSDMKNILEGFDAVEKGTKLTESVDEGSLPMPAPMAPEMDKGNPVTMNISLNASGKDHVADLLDMMKNAGLGNAGMADKEMPKLSMPKVMTGTPVDDPEIPGKDDKPGDMDLKTGGCGMEDIEVNPELGDDDLNSLKARAGLDTEASEDYANEPGEEYAPYTDMTNPPTNDLNKSKKSYPKVAGGDNPMALKDKIKEELNSHYKKYQS
jgi:uncharacterized protein YidB (DUF937 family)